METAITFLAFTAAWCGACKDFKSDFADDPRIAIVDIADDRERTAKYAIQTVPTIVAVKDGEELARFVGYPGKRRLRGWMQRLTDASEVAVKSTKMNTKEAVLLGAVPMPESKAEAFSPKDAAGGAVLIAYFVSVAIVLAAYLIVWAPSQ